MTRKQVANEHGSAFEPRWSRPSALVPTMLKEQPVSSPVDVMVIWRGEMAAAALKASVCC